VQTSQEPPHRPEQITNYHPSRSDYLTFPNTASHFHDRWLTRPRVGRHVKRGDGSVSPTYQFQTCQGVGDLPRRRPTRAPILGVAAPDLPTTYPESPTPRPKKPRLGRWDDFPRDSVPPGTLLGRADRRPYALPPNHGVPRLHCGWAGCQCL